MADARDDPIELLRAFRADVPEPSAEARALARARMSERTSGRRSRRWTGVPTLRRRVGAAAVVAVATAVAATVVLLLTPWRSGPGALTPAQASVVLQRVAAATAPRSGFVFHEQTVTLRAGSEPVTQETWRQDAPPYRFRVIVTKRSGARVEIGGTASRLFVYDGRKLKLFEDRPQIRLTPRRAPLERPVLRELLDGESVTPQDRRWTVVAKTKLGGRRVYRLDLRRPSTPDLKVSYYVDAETYVPVQIQTSELARGASRVTRVVSYEHLRPTAAIISRTDILTQHTDARIVSGTNFPRAMLELGVR